MHNIQTPYIRGYPTRNNLEPTCYHLDNFDCTRLLFQIVLNRFKCCCCLVIKNFAYKRYTLPVQNLKERQQYASAWSFLAVFCCQSHTDGRYLSSRLCNLFHQTERIAPVAAPLSSCYRYFLKCEHSHKPDTSAVCRSVLEQVLGNQGLCTLADLMGSCHK